MLQMFGKHGISINYTEEVVGGLIIRIRFV